MTCKKLIQQNTTPLYAQSVFDPPKEYEKFSYKKTTIKNGNIKLDEIQGMFSRETHENTWFNTIIGLRHQYLLDKLKCDDCNMSGDCYDIRYYTDLDYRENYDTSNWRIVFINDIGYIMEGYHRTTIAKFLSSLNIIPNEITIPNVEYNQIDYGIRRKFNILQQKINLIEKCVNDGTRISIAIKRDKINEILLENKRIEEYHISFTLNITFEQSNDEYKKTYDSMELLRKDIFINLRQYKNENSQKLLPEIVFIKKLFKKRKNG